MLAFAETTFIKESVFEKTKGTGRRVWNRHPEKPPAAV